MFKSVSKKLPLSFPRKLVSGKFNTDVPSGKAEGQLKKIFPQLWRPF